jgi:hypothetical protein
MLCDQVGVCRHNLHHCKQGNVFYCNSVSHPIQGQINHRWFWSGSSMKAASLGTHVRAGLRLHARSAVIIEEIPLKLVWLQHLQALNLHPRCSSKSQLGNQLVVTDYRVVLETQGNECIEQSWRGWMTWWAEEKMHVVQLHWLGYDKYYICVNAEVVQYAHPQCMHMQSLSKVRCKVRKQSLRCLHFLPLQKFFAFLHKIMLSQIS